MRVCLLAGGTGGAKLAAGLQSVLEPGELTVIANTADDSEFWGLHVSPDSDSVLFRLAGIFNEEKGFGVADDTFAVHGMMSRLGQPDWFWLGDRDLAFHITRSELLRGGARLTEASLELCRRLGLATRVLPMSDLPVRTFFETAAGRLAFQEYFVRERCEPELRSIEFVGIENAEATPEVSQALEAAELVVIGPSNPLISVAPILGVLGELLPAQKTLAVSPFVGGRSLKGPSASMMVASGLEASAVGVAREYRGRGAWFVIDELDRGLAGAVAELGWRVLVTDTVMTDGGARLAAAILHGVQS